MAATPQTESSPEILALVQRLVLERAATVASLHRLADEREEQLFAELAAKDRKLRAEQKAKREAQADLAEVTAALAGVTFERQKLVDEISARERQFAADIGEYRKQVASIADSPDPRKQAALQRYAEGERLSAYEDLKLIQRAETKAVAAGWRELGALALDLKDRGEIGTNEVVSDFEEAQRLDPGDAWGWLELARLYQTAGRLVDARYAADQALEHAGGEQRYRAAALNELGAVLESSGDLAGARSRYESSLKILEALASSNPSSAEAKRDVIVSLERLGTVLVLSGDLVGARFRYESSLKIRETLASSNPSSTVAQRDLMVAHVKLAVFPQGEGHLREALRIALALQSEGRLPASDENLVILLRELSAETAPPKDPQ